MAYAEEVTKILRKSNTKGEKRLQLSEERAASVPPRPGKKKKG